MKQNTVTLRISRDSYIEANKDIALIRLDTMNHLVGQPVMISYYSETGTEEIETITAIGVKDGIGKDCYSIVSTSKENIVNGIYDELPDVSELKNGARYICKLEGIWSLVYIQGDIVRTIETLSKHDPQIIRDLTTGFRWFFVNNVFKREDDFLQKDDIVKLIDERLIEIHKPTINVKLIGGDYYILGTVIENPVFEINIVNYLNVDITEDCQIEISSDTSGEETIINISQNKYTISGELSTNTKYTITAKYRVNNKEIVLVKDLEVNFGLYTYYGSVTDRDAVINLDELNKIAWNGKGSLDLIFDLYNQYSVVIIPSNFESIARITDINGLNYIDDYTVTSISDEKSYNYNCYMKKDKVIIDNFKQVFTYE